MPWKDSAKNIKNNLLYWHILLFLYKDSHIYREKFCFMDRISEDFHNLPKALNKKELSFYVKKEKSASKKDETCTNLLANFDPWNWIQHQFEQAIWEKPAIVKKNIKLWYSLQQIHAYIHREIQKVVEIQGKEAITNWNWYGELFSLSNNLGIYITLNKKKIKRNDVQHFIDIIDAYQLNGYSGEKVLGIHWLDFLNDSEIRGTIPPKKISRNLTLIKNLISWNEIPLDCNFPVLRDTKDFEEQYKEILWMLAKKYKGMLSIWGKIHFSEAIPQEKIEKFKQNFWFASTSFKLIHANTSLLLPPSYFPEELALMIGFLQKEGLIEGYPQLQLSIPSRLPNWAAAMLWSCTLFSSNIHVEYAPDAFKTSHDSQTGSKIMVYDDGKLEKDFKWIPKNIVNGRTDMMGIRDISLIPLYHLVGTLLCHGIYKGKFQKQGIQFMKEYKELLEHYQLLSLLDKEWIHMPDIRSSQQELDYSATEHYKTIKTCTDQHLSDWKEHNSSWQQDWLLVFELEKLLDKYKNMIYYNTSFLQLISNSCVKLIDILQQ